ncbi:MAG: DUF4864 domain-containing protein [Dermatophilaceae bacterium]
MLEMQPTVHHSAIGTAEASGIVETRGYEAARSAGMVPRMTRLRSGALAAVSLLALSACASTSKDPIALPSKDAAPAEVLGVYLRALKTGDCKAAHAVATSTFTFGNGELCGHLSVKSYTPVGDPATPGDQAIFSTNLITEGGDASMPDGLHTWFYTLVRQADGAWRLVGGGSGP